MAKAPKTPKRPRDLNQLAKRIVDLSVGEATDDAPEPTPKQERAAKGGKARASKLGPKERSRIARKAAKARWSKD